MAERGHAMKEIPGHRIEMKAEEILDLRAGDQDGYAVREADDDRSRKVFDGRTHARHSKEEQKNASHHRANKKAINAVLADDPSHNDDKCAGWAANLSFGPAQRGDKEPCDHGTVKTRLRRKAGGNSKCHGEWQSD